KRAWRAALQSSGATFRINPKKELARPNPFASTHRAAFCAYQRKYASGVGNRDRLNAQFRASHVLREIGALSSSAEKRSASALPSPGRTHPNNAAAHACGEAGGEYQSMNAPSRMPA